MKIKKLVLAKNKTKKDLISALQDVLIMHGSWGDGGNLDKAVRKRIQEVLS